MHRKDDFLEIRLPKCIVFLRPAEINRLLMQDPVLFQQAIQRGKGILRARQARERNNLENRPVMVHCRPHESR